MTYVKTLTATALVAVLPLAAPAGDLNLEDYISRLPSDVADAAGTPAKEGAGTPVPAEPAAPEAPAPFRFPADYAGLSALAQAELDRLAGRDTQMSPSLCSVAARLAAELGGPMPDFCRGEDDDGL